MKRYLHDTYSRREPDADTWHETLRFDNPHSAMYNTGKEAMASFSFGRHVGANYLELHAEETTENKNGQQVTRHISFGSIYGEDLVALRDFLTKIIETKRVNSGAAT